MRRAAVTLTAIIAIIGGLAAASRAEPGVGARPGAQPDERLCRRPRRSGPRQPVRVRAHQPRPSARHLLSERHRPTG